MHANARNAHVLLKLEHSYICVHVNSTGMNSMGMTHACMPHGNAPVLLKLDHPDICVSVHWLALVPKVALPVTVKRCERTTT